MRSVRAGWSTGFAVGAPRTASASARSPGWSRKDVWGTSTSAASRRYSSCATTTTSPDRPGRSSSTSMLQGTRSNEPRSPASSSGSSAGPRSACCRGYGRRGICWRCARTRSSSYRTAAVTRCVSATPSARAPPGPPRPSQTCAASFPGTTSRDVSSWPTSWSSTTIRSAGSWRRTARSRADSRTRRSEPLLPAVDEVQAQRDREQHHEDHEQEERDAGDRDQRRAWADALLGLVLERLHGLDGVLDVVEDLFRLVDRIRHDSHLP